MIGSFEFVIIILYTIKTNNLTATFIKRIYFYFHKKKFPEKKILNQIKTVSSLKYSPISAWCNTTVPVGARFLQLSVLCAAKPKPNGTLFILKTTTPEYCGVFSVILANPVLGIWSPYKNFISLLGLTHTLYFAYGAIWSNAVICILNFLFWLNLPIFTPNDVNESLEKLLAYFTILSLFN